jgi:NAD(P)-dependent dehydrogenase (short-subunit alcohol dehydrogenase family)
MQLQQKTAFITGAASGLGLAAAQRLVSEGVNVMMFDLDATRVQEQAERLGTQATWAAGDVSNEEQVQSAIEKTLSTFGSLHININSLCRLCQLQVREK